MLLVTPEEMGEAPPSCMWEHQVIGLEVRTREGRVLGEVVEVMETGANDVLVVEGEREFLIPAVEQVIKDVDEEKGTITIDPLPGLLEE
jgi:16S rRNA processing protein RimM